MINKGQSMFEVVIAIFIISMIIVGVVSLSTVSLSNSVFSRNKNLAGRYSQEAIEWLRSEREKDLTIFINYLASENYCLSSTPLSWSSPGKCNIDEFITGTIFKRELTFTVIPIDAGKNIIEATVVTSWDDSKGYHEAKATTNFGDIRNK